MGNANSYSYKRNDASQKMNDKNLIYIAMHSEIKEALDTKDPDTVKKLISEVTSHMIDLQQLKAMGLSNTEIRKCRKIFKNFEIALASLESVLVEECPGTKQDSSQFERGQPSRINLDLVSDLIHLDYCDNVSINASSNEEVNKSSTKYAQFQKDTSPNQEPCHTSEDIFKAIVCEFNFLMEKLQRPINDLDDYYQIDKGLSFLQLQVNSVELPESSPLYATKFKLLEQLENFRSMLDQKSGELEEQQQLSKEVNILELTLDSAVTEQELENLNRKAQLIQETIEKSAWDDHLAEKKIEILRQLSDLIIKINYTLTESRYVVPSEHLYGNVRSLPSNSELKEQDELECIQSIDRVLEEESNNLGLNEDEAVYANVVKRCKSDAELKPRVHRTSSNASQRGTVYINADIVRQNSPCDNKKLGSGNILKYLEPINKRPLPLPRNYEEKVISDLPNQWKRLNKIFNSQCISDAEKFEVAEISKQAEIAKNMFERKIRQIMEKLKESVEL